MRLGPARAAATRQDRTSQLHRDQEAAPKLRVMFPAVEQLRIELNFEGGGATTPVAQSHVLHPPARAYFSYPCPYADCDGRFELDAAAHAAVGDPSHRVEGVLECTGQRTSELATKRPCQLRLHFALRAICSPVG